MKRYAWISTAVIILIFSIATFASAGFGVSPPRIIEDRLVPGSSFERVIMLVQGTPDRALPAKVEVDADEIGNWISFPDGTEFVIPQGVQQYPLKVRIEVPESADLGIYKAFIRINTTPPAADESGEVAIALGGRIDVTLTVGDNVVFDYEILDLEILDIKEWDRPEIRVKIKNNGNVPAAPDSATFELFDKYGNTRLAFAQTGSGDFSKVPAFSEETILIDFPLDIRIAVGQYRGHAKVFNDDGEIIREVNTPFDVLPKTFLEKFGLYIGVGVGVIIILALVFFIWRLKKKRKLKVVEVNDQTTTGAI